MYRKKFLPKLVIASLLVGGVNFVPAVVNFGAENRQIISVASAEVKMYVGVSEDYANQIENQEVAKLRAKDKAVKKAVEQAGIYLKSYTKTVNAVLTDDEISVIASNTYEIVGDVKYERTINQISDETAVIVWKATVNVNVDDSEVKNWISRESQQKSEILNINKQQKISSAKNETEIEDLRKRAANAKTDAEKSQLKTEFDKIDNDFLYNQKIEEGNAYFYAEKYRDAVNSYTEAIKLYPNNSTAYVKRGHVYRTIGAFHLYDNPKLAKENGNLSLSDLNKAIEIDPKNSDAYRERGSTYGILKEREKQFDDLNKAIELNPDYAQNYLVRALWFEFKYSMDKLYKKPIQQSDVIQAMEDFNKAIELDPNNPDFYYVRGYFYYEMETYDKAIQDYNKAIQLGAHNLPMLAVYYCNRGKTYEKLKDRLSTCH